MKLRNLAKSSTLETIRAPEMTNTVPTAPPIQPPPIDLSGPRVPWRINVDDDRFFDRNLYLHLNEDVRLAGLEPLQHFKTHGLQEGRAAFRVSGKPDELSLPTQIDESLVADAMRDLYVGRADIISKDKKILLISHLLYTDIASAVLATEDMF